VIEIIVGGLFGYIGLGFSYGTVTKYSK